MRGLSNLGNTCYLNFILQILFNTPGFREKFKHYMIKKSDHPLYPTVRLFFELMECYHRDTEEKELRQSLQRFVQSFHQSYNQFGFGQQDGQEYLMFLMRAIHDSNYSVKNMVVHGTPSTPEDLLEQQSFEAHRIDGSSTTELMLNKDDNRTTCYDSVIFNMFCGQYRFQTQCRNPSCNYISNRFDSFKGCELPIGNPDKQNITLLDVLDEHTSVTELDDIPDEFYECYRCKVRTRSLRRCTFWRLPQVLVISLKRLVHHAKDGQYWELKDGRQVQIPDILDLAGYCSAPREQTRYRLYATGNHIGTHGGHYYAQIKDADGNWIIVNDDKVQQGQGPTDNVYMLFYIKENS
jgi:ubiquitin C-terminal hydrolase